MSEQPAEPMCTCGYPARVWNTENGHAASCPVFRAAWKRRHVEADPRVQHTGPQRKTPHARKERS